MTALVIVARLVLATVFVLAGPAKLVDQPGFRSALERFGAPKPLVGPLSRLIPLAELAVGVALLAGGTSRWGATGALLLLAVFTGALSLNLARGRRPECRCFGQLRSSRISWSTVIRNGALVTIAAVVALRPDADANIPAWLGRITETELAWVCGGVLSVVVAVQGWLLLHLLRRNGRLLLQLETLESRVGPSPDHLGSRHATGDGLAVGSRAPEFTLSSLEGEKVTLGALRHSDRVMLIFSDPGCGPCRGLLPEVAGWQRNYAQHLTVGVISRGDLDSNRAMAAEAGLTNVLVQPTFEASDSYRVNGTPSAVLVDADGRIASATVAGADAIRALLIRTLGLARPTPVVMGRRHLPGRPRLVEAQPQLVVGSAAPPFTLPRVGGGHIALSDLKGRPTVLLFWDPGCGYCTQMQSQLSELEARPAGARPRLVIVASGTAAANAASGRSGPVALDADREVRRSFGATGTPMAVLIDAEGRVASDLAVGGPAVLALAGGPRLHSERRPRARRLREVTS